VLNLCDEGLRNQVRIETHFCMCLRADVVCAQARLELHVPAMLDTLEIPYSGAGAKSLAVCYDKVLHVCVCA
jgi:hypothetical protein